MKYFLNIIIDIAYIAVTILCSAFVSTTKPKSRSGSGSVWFVNTGGKKPGSWSSGRHK